MYGLWKKREKEEKKKPSTPPHKRDVAKLPLISRRHTRHYLHHLTALRESLRVIGRLPSRIVDSRKGAPCRWHFLPRSHSSPLINILGSIMRTGAELNTTLIMSSLITRHVAAGGGWGGGRRGTRGKKRGGVHRRTWGRSSPPKSVYVNK